MRSTRSTMGRISLGAALCFALFCAQASTTLYKWVDADGVTHYSDRPEPGAQKVRIAEAQTYQGGVAKSADSRRQPSRPATDASYTRLAITNPEDGAVLWNTGGHVEVGAAVEPDLADGHQLWIVVDGKSQAASAGGSTSLELARGSHTIAASVTDAAGQELITSAPISVIVRQTSSAQPPQGPALPKSTKPKN
jgi:hypothetical protein